MEKYIEVELVKIEEDRVVVLDGEKYLVLGELSKPRYKTEEKKPVAKKKQKPRVDMDKVQEAVLMVLKTDPGLKHAQIRSKLLMEYKLNPSDSALRGLYGRMKSKGLIEVNGTKNGATWSIARPEPPKFELNLGN